MSHSIIQLYHLEGCPYCQLVRKKLQDLGVSVILTPVPKKREDRKDVHHASGQFGVPVLKNGEKVIVESSVILEYLDEKFNPNGKTPLSASSYGLGIEMTGTLDEIKEKTVTAFKEQGFGVLTEINVKETLKKKLDIDVPEQLILGACNPKIAHQALEMEKDLGLLLPCNVVIRHKEKNTYFVKAINPFQLIAVVGRDDMIPLAGQIQELIQNALTNLEKA